MPADTKISQLSSYTTPLPADLLPIVDTANNVTKKIALSSFLSDWVAISDTWTYASATTITVPTGAASKYQKGDKIVIIQTTAKYFYVVNVADTLLTVCGGSLYSVANAAMTPYYSRAMYPLGFPATLPFTWPTFDTAYLDNGTGGQQPARQANYFYMVGQIVNVYMSLGTSVKNTATAYFTFTLPSDLPALESTIQAAYEIYGFGYLLNGGNKGVMVRTNNSRTVFGIFTADNANIADNTALSSSGWKFSYLI